MQLNNLEWKPILLSCLIIFYTHISNKKIKFLNKKIDYVNLKCNILFVKNKKEKESK